MTVSAATFASPGGDRLRQALNLAFALGQVLTTALVVATGADNITGDDPGAITPIVPAGYAFGIWGVIYGGSLAYAVYQALPSRREDELLRRIGPFTAAAFPGTSLWLIAAQRGWIWPTVAVFFGILAALLGAFVGLIRLGAPRTTAERFCVVLPVSVYTGWATVATIANVSTALKASGFGGFGLAAGAWAVAMLIVAAGIALFVTLVSRGNVWYALTIVWALVGIAVANLTREPSPAVAVVAGGAAVLIALAALRARTLAPAPAPR